MDIIKVILTSLFSAASIFLIAKLMGHKQVAQLDFFDYVSGITIGSIAAEFATELEEPLNPLIALAVYGGISVLMSILTHKYPRTRKFINGTPSILMQDGKIYRDNLKKAKLDLSEFMLLCREQGFFDLDEISLAVFEHNGKLSILPKSANRPATPSDLGITAKATHIGIELIMDGRIMGENLERLGKNTDWLIAQLKPYGYSSAREIFLAVYRKEDNSFSIFKTD